MRKRKILIVDDQLTNRMILKKNLENFYDLSFAVNGKEALDEVSRNKNKYSAILLDIQMPIMSGFEFLNEVKKDKELGSIPVIVTTEFQGEDAEIEALSYGATDFLSKPYKPTIIKQRLENTIKLRETSMIINMVQKDELTGIYNKNFFLKLSQELMDTYPNIEYDMIVSNVVKFKVFNDIFGSKKGDALLIYLAQIFENTFEDGLVGRFNSDIFAILVPRLEKSIKTKINKINKEIAKFDTKIDIRVCFGIFSDNEIRDSVVMCERARFAVDTIKQNYNHLFCYYDSEIREKLLYEQELINSIEIGIKKRHFLVYFQPKVDLRTGIIVGAEALVRWDHPKLGFITPDKFISIFEKNGYISQLDYYVWEETCRKLEVLNSLGYPPIAISVNVSRVDAFNTKLPETLHALVKKYNIDPKYFHLEVTETAYTENSAQLVEVLTRLKELEFVIEMDDFGSAYSSLNMLSSLPIDILKIDMSFIQNAEKNERSMVILGFIIKMARALDLYIIAEGVEKQQQVTDLIDLGCNYAQGYYYSKAIPFSDFKNLLEIDKIFSIIK